MTVSERFHAIMNFEPFDRLPLVEWATWWNKTIERWQNEGLPRELNMWTPDLHDYFGLDRWQQFWFRSIHWNCPKPPPGEPLLKPAMEAYDALRPHLFSIEEGWPIKRENLEAAAARQATGDTVLWFTVDGFFWLPRTLMGDEEHLYAFYDEPELLHRINQDNADWMLKIIDEICKTCTPDFMTFAEDMSYNKGPMLSEEMFNKFMKPYYEQVIPALKERGIRVFVDSDGDISSCASWFAGAGLEGILPLERQAGVDMSQLRRDNPDQLYIGGFDKMTMPKGEAAMREEFERLLPVAAKGGYIISCDHQTPPGVSLENYQTYLKLFREYAEKAGQLSQAI
jgi:hypothetical protein